MSIVNLANNNFSGRFPRSWTFLPWLSQVDLSYNSLSGTLPDQLAFQSMLTSLRLHSNPGIKGTLSPLFRCAQPVHEYGTCNLWLAGRSGQVVVRQTCRGAPVQC